jgi:hypothetical protein
VSANSTSPSIPTPAQPSLGARLRRLAAIMLVFIVVGPPVGLMVSMLSIALIGSAKFNLWALAGVVLLAPSFAIPLYLSGLKSAGALGLLVGIRQSFFGAITWAFAVAVGIAAGLVAVLLSSLARSPGSDTYIVLTANAVTIAAYLCITFVCWAMVQNWYFERARADRVTE